MNFNINANYLFIYISIPSRLKNYELDEIAKEIENFRVDNSRCPKDLNELKPDYLGFIYFSFEYKSEKNNCTLWYEEEGFWGFKYWTYWTCNNYDWCYKEYSD